MSSNINLQAYNSIEQLSAYTPESMQEYRDGRIARYQKHVEFMLKRSGDKPVSMIEIGSGSSALLYAFAQRNMLERAMGVELSTSRTEFANKWKEDEGYGMVENLNDNFINIDMGKAAWDWFLVIDNTFTYLYPEDKAYPSMLLEKAAASLKKGGRIIIDFINYAARVPGTEYKLWSAFQEKDPYSYGLYSNKVTDGINRSESIFIKRDGSTSEKIELCKVYSKEDLSAMLESFGFTVEGVFATFDEQPFIPADSDRMMVVAKKN